MTARETAGREGKGEDGRARTREVKLAVFFPQDKVDDEGFPIRDRESSSYIATFEPAAVFGGLVKAEGTRHGADYVRQLTILGDGAAWIWNIGQRLKQSGMHWTTDGADAIIALRCREASSQWEAICNTPHTQTRTA